MGRDLGLPVETPGVAPKASCARTESLARFESMLDAGKKESGFTNVTWNIGASLKGMNKYRPFAAYSNSFLSAILASSTLLVSPLSAQQEERSQQERSSGADAAIDSQFKSADEEKTDQRALPNSQPGTSQSGTSQPGTSPVGTSNDRLFNLLPNFLTLENAGQRPPLTTNQKFKVVARSSFD
jgi:hypothetical protein